jgi:hypothetical protein
VQNATPEIDRWWAVWETESHEEIRGAGELHISANACADISEKITSVNDTVKAESQQIQTNQQETYNWLQDFNATMNDRFVTVLSAIGNLTFNDTAIMDKLTSIENSLTNLENNMASLINTAKADILSLMNSYYSNILSAILALPDSITMQISTQAPDWISCAAQKITGVYPAGSTCR